MTTKRKMSETKAIANLRERVEDLATKMVLGDTDGEQWAVLLDGVRREAEAAARTNVARIAAETLGALSNRGRSRDGSVRRGCSNFRPVRAHRGSSFSG